MLNKKLFDDISSKISDTIANSPIKDVEQNIKAILTSTLSRLNLVTREEYEIQQQVLLKTREKLAELEAQVTALAGKISEQPAQIKDHTSESADTDQNQPAL